MRFLLAAILVLMAIPFAMADVSVNHFVEESHSGEPIYVHAVVRADANTSMFDIGEFIPETWTIEDWSVQNYDKAEVLFSSEQGEFLGNEYNINHWTFDKLTHDIILDFKISPKSAGNYELVSLWFYPDGFDMDRTEFTVTEKSSPLTGYAVAGSGKTSSGVATTVTIKSSIGSVLANVNSIELY